MLSFYPEKGIELFTIKITIVIDGESAGHYLLIPHSEQMYEMHQSPLDRKYLGKATMINTHAIGYVFNNMKKIEKIVAIIPVNNRLAIRLAKLCNLKLEGCITNSFMLDGKMIDQEIYGISRGDI